MVRNRSRSSRRDEIEKLDQLPWSSSVTNEDPFAAFAGSDNFEGGFMSLEEIDASEYNFTIHDPGNSIETEKPGATSIKKKRKQTHTERGEDAGKVDGEEKMGEEGSVKPKKKKKKKKNENKKKAEQAQDKEIENSGAPSKTKKRKRTNTQGGKDAVKADGEDKIGEEGSVKPKKQRKKKKNKKAEQSQDEVAEAKAEEVDEFADEHEFSAWNELRLHPLLMKAIYKLAFKEPTPIQKACIPAAAHQGKDVIGAAETGSGKTLAFGLPMLQRLLEEREKVEKLIIEDADAANKIAPRGFIRALIITPTRELAIQVTDHLKAAARSTNFHVVPIVGGMSSEKQERLLSRRPEIVVGTPGRLWELMSGGEKHLVELHSLSFFVLDEADRMIENGHFRELQSIIDMLPVTSGAAEDYSGNKQNCVTVSSVQRKKRQTFVFSATIALSSDFRKKLKRGHLKSSQSMTHGLSSLETLSERAGMRPDAAIVDLTNASIMASNLEESFLECKEEDKDAYLYYILCVHGRGRTIVFCTSIAALRHVSALLRILNVSVWTIHAQMQQRARLKAVDRFRENENGILVATDVFARGLDIPGVRTVIHYQLPHSAEVYVHRSGRTARASTEGCSVALISPKDRSKFASLCRSFSKDTLQRFPIDSSFMPEVLKRLSLARQVDKISRKESQEKASKSWIQRSAELIGLDVEDDDSEDERVNKCKQVKATSTQLKKLQQELHVLLSRPLQPKSFSHRFLAGGGISPDLQRQLEQLTQQKLGSNNSEDKNKLAVIGQDFVEPLEALRRAGSEVCMDIKKLAEKQRNMENIRRKRKDAKKRQKEQKRKERKKT